jgi:hypothetical protein
VYILSCKRFHAFPPELHPKCQVPTPKETAVVAELMGDELLMRVLGIEGQDVKRASDAADGHRRDQ